VNDCRLDAQGVFAKACAYAYRTGWQAEVERHRGATLESFSETQFLSEAAWVILCSGFREAIVRRSFNHISLCFFDWESATLIVEHSELCVQSARGSLGNGAKLRAIVACAEAVVVDGFAQLKREILENPIIRLRALPYVGPITVFHLAKNLGLDVAKPDRHLARLAMECGYLSAAALCEDLARRNNEEVKVVDLILWRFLAENPGGTVARGWRRRPRLDKPDELCSPC
jgi:hypothetical protein